ncbi:hypothetical protein TNCV_4571121 [Trichonephila clavipes]|nr:hypothetical protein TNCV_4571121 [Trichonephila clavipes]
MKDIAIKTGYVYLLMFLPRLPLVGLELTLTPVHLVLRALSAWSDDFDGKIFEIFMALRAVSVTPGQNIVILIDSQAATKTISDLQSIPLRN